MLFLKKKKINIIIYSIVIAALLLCAVGSKSLSGVMGIFVSVVFIIVLMRKYLIKRYYITIPAVLLLVIGVLIFNYKSDQFLWNKLMSSLEMTKTEYALSQMETNKDNVSLVYNGNTMYLQYVVAADKSASFVLTDDKGQLISCMYESATNSYTVTDERFKGLSFGMSTTYQNVFYILESGKQWNFTNQAGDNIYYYVNDLGKLDQMKTAKSALFTGYEDFASGRGYIWSRTIPLIKDYIILGSGQDTFLTAFPRQDYLNYTRTGYGNMVMTKPHNLYLQIAVQSGLLSLIAFLVFYGIYFVTSLRLYIKSRFSSFYAQVGLAIFVATIAYMFAGLANDSSITIAPVFLTLMGLGITVNYKAKPLIENEIKEQKAQKEPNTDKH
jgi:hypothetical protein